MFLELCLGIKALFPLQKCNQALGQDLHILFLAEDTAGILSFIFHP